MSIDFFIAVDWSGAKRLRKNLWAAHAHKSGFELACFRSREELIGYLVSHCVGNRATVIGLDFAFSFPIWFLRKNSITSANQVWSLCAQYGEEWLAKCESPFWGRTRKRRPDIEEHFRRSEHEVEAIAGVRPKSVFQIGGAGAVGTGSVRGMPFLQRLNGAGISIWSFDSARKPFVIEIYPRLLTRAVVKSSAKARRTYIAQYWPQVSPTARQDMISSEDAFDAAVSALVMQREGARLNNLSRPADKASRLEGWIWAPLGSDSHRTQGDELASNCA